MPLFGIFDRTCRQRRLGLDLIADLCGETNTEILSDEVGAKSGVSWLDYKGLFAS